VHYQDAQTGCTDRVHETEDPVGADMGQEHQYRKKGNKNVSLLIKIIASAKQKYLALLVALHLSLVFGFNNLMASEGSFWSRQTCMCCNILVRGSCPRDVSPSVFALFFSLDFFPPSRQIPTS
jgi:hypothetical protein